MIWDCLMLGSELDMLAGRLKEMQDWPELCHVIVEAPVTHKGDPKPLHYDKNRRRFKSWAKRIEHVVADNLDPSLEAWPREHRQRDAAMRVLRERARPGDVVLICDVDEFVPYGTWSGLPCVSYNQRLAMYAVDWLYPQRHICSVAAEWASVRGPGLAAVRDNRYAYPVIDGGWHLTWLGGQEACKAKLEVTCHEEMTDKSRELLASGKCYAEGIHHTGDFQMVPADVDETWPGFIYRRECPDTWFRPRPDGVPSDRA